MGADLVAACPKPEAGTKEVGGCGHPPLRVSVERGSSGNQPFSVGAALVAARLAGAWDGNERGGRGQAPPLRVSVERGEQRTSVPVCPHISGAGKEKERRPKWAAFGKQLRT